MLIKDFNETENTEEPSERDMRGEAPKRLITVIFHAICIVALVVTAVVFYVKVTVPSDTADEAFKNRETVAPKENTRGHGSKDTKKPTPGVTVGDTAPTKTPLRTATPVPDAEKSPETTNTLFLKELASSQSYYDERKAEVLKKSAEGGYDIYTPSPEYLNENVDKDPDRLKSYLFSFERKNDHEVSGTYEVYDLSKFGSYYADLNVPDGEKVIYLTLDCGYYSDNIAKMLDIFKEKQVKCTFFVTNKFLERAVDDVIRMFDEGHCVANHTCSHEKITDLTNEGVVEEVAGFEERLYELTGHTCDPFFRLPEGRYSKRVLEIVKDLGYTNVFWSIAYSDYDRNNQPGKAYVLDHISTYHHNGAIILMHNVSDSNLEAMADVIDMLKAEGYRFADLYELLEHNGQ